MQERFWAGAKLGVFLFSVFYIASMNESIKEFNIFDAALISVFFFVCLSAWLFLQRKRIGAAFDTSITFSGPFWPMVYYPFQFWTLASATAICGGIANISVATESGHGCDIMGFFSFFWGISIALALAIQQRLSKPERGSAIIK